MNPHTKIMAHTKITKVRPIYTPILAALALCFTSALVAAAPRNSSLRKLAEAAAKPQPAAGPAIAFAPDKGKFRITQQGQEAGTEDFEISQSAGGWLVRGDSVIHAPGGDSHSTGTAPVSRRRHADPLRLGGSGAEESLRLSGFRERCRENVHQSGRQRCPPRRFQFHFAQSSGTR